MPAAADARGKNLHSRGSRVEGLGCFDSVDPEEPPRVEPPPFPNPPHCQFRYILPPSRRRRSLRGPGLPLLRGRPKTRRGGLRKLWSGPYIIICMYVYIYIYVCIYIYIYMYIHLHTYTYMHMYIYIYIYMCISYYIIVYHIILN